MNILIADDEPYMLKILQAYLEKESFTVYQARNGEEALHIFYTNKINLAIVDWMMPKSNGIQVCKEIKSQSKTTKVLLLTAKDEADDELIALQSGADEYISKPFDPRVLIVRVRKLLLMERLITIRDLQIDMDGQRIYRNHDDVQATNTEFHLMKYLIENRGIIISRKALLDHVWGFDYVGEERTVDTHIRRLRSKIGDHIITTHRGMGYSLDEPHE
ncbi:MAG: response regulator transcription factor [Candidatus Pristimantibacillus lignocellulolyticus]|uniref:Response regulator transcription factor n=1 Tax=Candidatus Pristimantibacillus lignocellulolyticus TaxID=2994561 RepID=A0A9J6ZHX9_9BACL|nr:MAG: response regulator transcription factor [Candidatus Pristimantibacillus lignocellulolyticus]